MVVNVPSGERKPAAAARAVSGMREVLGDERSTTARSEKEEEGDGEEEKQEDGQGRAGVVECYWTHTRRNIRVERRGGRETNR